MSSTRVKLAHGTIDGCPRTYLVTRLCNILRGFGWTVKKKKVSELSDQWVAIRPNTNEKSAQSGVDKFIGYQAILDMTYRSGFYYDFINTEAGKDYLVRAGI